MLSSGVSNSDVSFDKKARKTIKQSECCTHTVISDSCHPPPHFTDNSSNLFYCIQVTGQLTTRAACTTSPAQCRRLSIGNGNGLRCKEAHRQPPSPATPREEKAHHSPDQLRTLSCKCSGRPPTGWGSCHWGISQRGNTGSEVELSLSERPPEARGHCSSPARSTSTE